MDLHATAHGTANALRQLDGGIVATMGNGSVSARLVELASTDVAGLFRSSGTMTKLSCLLAVADIHGGVARLGPVRLRSAQGTIVAHGTVNLPRDALDVVVAGEDSTTGVLALDIPVHVTGSLGDPSVGLAGSGRAELPGRCRTWRPRCGRLPRGATARAEPGVPARRRLATRRRPLRARDAPGRRAVQRTRDAVGGRAQIQF